MRVNAEDTKYLEDLFVKQKLYHSLSRGFNDPFECKPYFTMENSKNDAKNIRDHLKRVFRNGGMTSKKADALVSNSMKDPNFIRNTIAEITENSFKELRICSFTTNKENLLFWSHYANSHKGICIEFNATVEPISMAFKVEYSNDYPQVTYPSQQDKRGFKPALVKAMAWEYENEYRTMFLPSLMNPINDGESLLLDERTITNVYMGSEISNKDKEAVLDLISKSNFRPTIWQASLSRNSFKLEFTKLKV